MTDEYDIYNELEAQRNIESQEPEELNQPEPYKMGAGSYVLILFALFVDIIEIITTYTGVGLVIAVPLGLVVDAAIFLSLGISKKGRKQKWKLVAGFLGENFPIIAQALEWFPVRTIVLILTYRGMNKQQPEESGGKKEETNE